MIRLILIIQVLLLISCRNGKTPQEPQEAQTASNDYMPVREYILTEIRSLDSIPVGILKKVSLGNRTDSGFIQPAEFKTLAAEFLPDDLEPERFKSSFSENSFFDQTTEALTFTYEGKDPALVVRRVDVLASPGSDLDRIKSIYMEKAYKSGDTTINKKMYWKAGTSFQILTQRSLQDQPAVIEQLKVIWDPLNY